MSEQSRTQTLVRYQLRSTEAGYYMIDKLVGSDGFDPPIYERRRCFGPFKSRETARRFMVRHGGRP